MVANMQQPWSRGYDHDTPDHDGVFDDMRDSASLTFDARSSLGQLIDRSTSAPPMSSGDPNRDSLFLGSKLFASVNGVSVSQQHGSGQSMSTFFRASSGVDSQAPTPTIENSSYRENPVPENDTFRAVMLSSMIDNSGRATAPSSSGSIGSSGSSLSALGGGRSSIETYDFGSDGAIKSHSPTLAMDTFQRSHSAAPPSSATSLAPPPGLPALNRDLDRRALTRRPISEIKRPASTGILDISSSSALRPSAKTLMDLIQEDYSEDNQDHRDNYFGNETPTDRFNPNSQSSNSQQFFARQHGAYTNRDSHYPPAQSQVQPQQQQQQQLHIDQLQQQVQQIRLDSRSGVTGQVQVQQVLNVGSRDTSLGAVRLQQQQNLQQQQAAPIVLAQRYLPSGQFDGRDSVNSDVPSSLYPPAQVRPQQQQLQTQQGQQIYVSTPGRQPQPGAIITNQEGQQVFYQHQVEVSPPRIQAQVLPNGQTVYIQTTSAPPSQQPGFTYSTIQYQQPPDQSLQPTRIVSTPATLMRQNDGTYIQVPVQGLATPQVSYWDGQGQTLIVGAPGVPSIMPSSVNMGHVMTQQQQSGVVDHQFGPGALPNRHVQQHGIPYSRGGREKGGSTSSGGSGGRSRRAGHQSRRTEPKSHSNSSPLLEEFRSNKNRQWTVPQIEGHVVEFCQDQNGSRFIQQRLELGDRLEQDIVVREVLPAIRRLRNDVFGNYVVQKLLDFGSPQVRASIRDTLEGEMLQLSLQMYGCRVVQKALEALSDADLSRLLEEFRHNVLSCIHDQNGNHVIQKCIEAMNTRAKTAETNGDYEKAQLSRDQIDFIINDILVNATTLSCHPFGCRVLQRILEHCDESRKIKLLDEVMKSHKRLLDDQYGNYVIQHVLQYGRVVDRDSILAIVVESGLLTLSRQKFASNVVEKLLKYGNAPQRRAISREMLKKTNEQSVMNMNGGDTSIVLLMVRDAYANYVVQTTLDVVPDSEERTLLLNELNSHSEELRNYTFAKHIVAKLTALEDSKDIK